MRLFEEEFYYFLNTWPKKHFQLYTEKLMPDIKIQWIVSRFDYLKTLRGDKAKHDKYFRFLQGLPSE